MPHAAASCDTVPQSEPSLSVAEAAQQLRIPERTLRAWIAEGRVEVFRPDPNRRGMRIRQKVLEAVRQHAAESGSLPHSAADCGSIAAELELLRARLEGAQAALRLHAQRRTEERQRYQEERKEWRAHHQAELDREREERAKLEEELQFLRDRLVQAEREGEQMRILMAQGVQAQQQTARELEELRLKALPEPRKTRWAFWRRG